MFERTAIKKITFLISVFFCCHAEAQFDRGASAVQSVKTDSLLSIIKQSEKKVVVVNFWAMFCKPCLEEIPGMVRSSRLLQKQVDLFLISVDTKEKYPKEIQAFANKWRFDNVLWLNETDADYFIPKIEKQWSGALPATIFYNKETGYKYFYEWEMTDAIFLKALAEAIRGEVK